MENEYLAILQEDHSGQAGGHFLAERTAKTIMYAKIWWPKLFMDADMYVQTCDECQRTKIPMKKDEMPM